MRAGVGVYGAGTTLAHSQQSQSSSSLLAARSQLSSVQPSSVNISPSSTSAAASTAQNPSPSAHLETTIISGGQKDALKTQFATREGVYRQMTISEQLSKSRVAMAQGSSSTSNAPVRVSFVRVPASAHEAADLPDNSPMETVDGMPAEESSVQERVCFNIGRDLYVYNFENAQGTFDWSKPLDKRVYKGTYPTCHDFNHETVTPTSCALIVGFSAGQIQMIDPFQKEYPTSKLFNEERLIEKTSVTCLKWIPGQSQQFLVSHHSGFMYVYSEELPCVSTAPTYQLLKQSDHCAIHTMKNRPNRNPVRRIKVGKGAVNQFEFAPGSGELVAMVGQMRSYFGGLLCLAWSPDQRLIATGGEDDLLTVFSVQEDRVLCRGQGHKSWVSQVAFDSYLTNTSAAAANDAVSILNGTTLRELNVGSVSSTEDLKTIVTADMTRECTHLRFNSSAKNGSKAENGRVEEPLKARLTSAAPKPKKVAPCRGSPEAEKSPPGAASLPCVVRNGELLDESLLEAGGSGDGGPCFYRIGTVSHDTQLCLWDIGNDILQQGAHFQQPCSSGQMTSSALSSVPSASGALVNNLTSGEALRPFADGRSSTASPTTTAEQPPDSEPAISREPTLKETKPAKPKRFLHRRVLSFGNRHSTAADRTTRNGRSSASSAVPPSLNGSQASTDASLPVDPASQLFGSQHCPRMDAVPIVEPLICKKIAHERLTVLSFRQDSLVTACQEGFICTWSRPGRVVTRI